VSQIKAKLAVPASLPDVHDSSMYLTDPDGARVD